MKDLNSEDNIAKGRHHLKMKVRQKYGGDNPESELLKVPLEALHSIALQQIGEQEAYIEELEEKISVLEKELSKKESKLVLSREENRRIALEVRRDQVIAGIYENARKAEAENRRLRKQHLEVVNQLCLKIRENESLKELLDQQRSNQ